MENKNLEGTMDFCKKYTTFTEESFYKNDIIDCSRIIKDSYYSSSYKEKIKERDFTKNYNFNNNIIKSSNCRNIKRVSFNQISNFSTKENNIKTSIFDKEIMLNKYYDYRRTNKGNYYALNKVKYAVSCCKANNSIKYSQRSKKRAKSLTPFKDYKHNYYKITKLLEINRLVQEINPLLSLPYSYDSNSRNINNSCHNKHNNNHLIFNNNYLLSDKSLFQERILKSDSNYKNANWNNYQMINKFAMNLSDSRIKKEKMQTTNYATIISRDKNNKNNATSNDEIKINLKDLFSKVNNDIHYNNIKDIDSTSNKNSFSIEEKALSLLLNNNIYFSIFQYESSTKKDSQNNKFYFESEGNVKKDDYTSFINPFFKLNKEYNSETIKAKIFSYKKHMSTKKKIIDVFKTNKKDVPKNSEENISRNTNNILASSKINDNKIEFKISNCINDSNYIDKNEFKEFNLYKDQDIGLEPITNYLIELDTDQDKSTTKKEITYGRFILRNEINKLFE